MLFGLFQRVCPIVSCRNIARGWILLVSWLAPDFAFGEQPKPLKTENPMECILNYAWAPVPPFVMLDANNPEIASGYQADYMRWIAADMGCRLEYFQLTWEEVLKKLQLGEIHVAGRASKTREREQWAYFSEGYDAEIMVLMMRNGEARRHGQADLKTLLKNGFRLGLIRGAYYGKTVESLRQSDSDNYQIKQYGFASDVASALQNREIDGYFEAPFTIDDENRKHPDYITVEEYPLEIITGEVFFIFSRASVKPELVIKFNQSMLRVKTTSAYKNHPYWSEVE